MKEQKKHISYTAADLLRYHGGTMSAGERHALEKAALDDPFLADALEGYVHAVNTEAEISDLQKRLQQRVRGGKLRSITSVRSLAWIRIAALFLVIAGAGWGVYYLSAGKDDNVALSTPLQKDKQDEKAESAGAGVAGDSTAATVLDNSVAAGNATAQDVGQPPAPAPLRYNRVQKRSEGVTAQQEENLAASLENTATGVTVYKDTAAATSTAAAQHVFEGKVTDEKGAPLPNVAITANNKQSTLTDLNGNFSLKGTDSVLTATASAVGYQQNRLFLSAPSQNKIVLTEAENALAEVVVTGMGQPKRAARKHVVETGELEGTERWRSFDDYVANNIKVPEDLAQKKEGEVRLSFELDKEGTPVNIKVESSLCALCDKEAIRLLQEGPKWKKSKTKKRKVTIPF